MESDLVSTSLQEGPRTIVLIIQPLNPLTFGVVVIDFRHLGGGTGCWARRGGLEHDLLRVLRHRWTLIRATLHLTTDSHALDPTDGPFLAAIESGLQAFRTRDSRLVASDMPVSARPAFSGESDLHCDLVWAGRPSNGSRSICFGRSPNFRNGETVDLVIGTSAVRMGGHFISSSST